MQARAGKLNLFLFIDAFGWELLQRHPGFLQGLVRGRKKLDTILGYSSACDPSIISGLAPAEHGLWSSYHYDPAGSPFKWTKPLRFLPAAVANRGRVRSRLGRWIARRCGFTGYFQLYNVPLGLLPLFNYAEQRRIWEPGGLPCGTTIFDRLAAAGIPWFVHRGGEGDAARLDRLAAAIRARSIGFAYCSLGRLDALMHAKGTGHPGVAALLEWYDGRIRALLDIAAQHYGETAWYLFTDHGMHDVVETCDLMRDIEALGLAWNHDYAAFYDATMARFWFLNDRARQAVADRLDGHPQGRILPEAELKELGVWFADGRYGELVFLLDPGIQIVPGFMGAKPCRGMHGYHPSSPGSFAAISSNRPIPDETTGIRHIHQIMLRETGLG